MDPRCPVLKDDLQPATFDASKTYAIDDLVSWFSPIGQDTDIYKLVTEAPAGTLPSDSAWKAACSYGSLTGEQKTEWDTKVQAANNVANDAIVNAICFDTTKRYDVGDYIMYQRPPAGGVTERVAKIYKLVASAPAGTFPSENGPWKLITPRFRFAAKICIQSQSASASGAPAPRSSGAILKEKMDILQANITKTTTNAQAVANVAKTIGGRRKSKRKAARKTKRKAKKTHRR